MLFYGTLNYLSVSQVMVLADLQLLSLVELEVEFTLKLQMLALIWLEKFAKDWMKILLKILAQLQTTSVIMLVISQEWVQIYLAHLLKLHAQLLLYPLPVLTYLKMEMQFSFLLLLLPSESSHHLFHNSLLILGL